MQHTRKLAALCLCAAALSGCVGSMPLGLGGGNSSNGNSSASPCSAAVPATPLQRLTQQQYTASVAALLQLPVASLAPAELPQDEAVGPFAANTQAPVGDLSLEQYQAAAAAYAAQAMNSLASILPCNPNALDAACAKQFIAQFGQRAFRRPLTADEAQRYSALIPADPTDPNGIRLLVQAFLQSPYFLYRPEFGDPSTAQGGTVALTGYERASRLAFMLWNRAPDDALLQAAASGALDSAAGTQAQVDRLLSDARYGSSVATFLSSLLNLGTLAAATKDPNIYPQYTPALEAALQQETQDFVSYVLQGNMTLANLLSNPTSVLSEPLFAYYGVTKPANYAAGTPVLLGAQRAGLLTRGAFLASHAHAQGSAPVQRGKIIRENLLSQAMPAPPPGVSLAPPVPKPGSTTRELLLLHETNPSCAACHVLMDHIGFAFEHFDGVGAWRDQDSGKAVDATGNIVGSPASNVSFDGAAQLSTDLAASPDVAQCVVKQMFRYGMARAETTADACTLAQLNTRFAASQGDLRGLMQALIAAPTFSRLQVSPPATR